jgi:hypothetical protein
MKQTIISIDTKKSEEKKYCKKIIIIRSNKLSRVHEKQKQKHA